SISSGSMSCATTTCPRRRAAWACTGAPCNASWPSARRDRLLFARYARDAVARGLSALRFSFTPRGRRRPAPRGEGRPSRSEEQRVRAPFLLGRRGRLRRGGPGRRGLLRLDRLLSLAVDDHRRRSVVGRGRGVRVLDLTHQIADRIGRDPAFGQGRTVGNGLDRQLGQGGFHKAAPDGGGGR